MQAYQDHMPMGPPELVPEGAEEFQKRVNDLMSEGADEIKKFQANTSAIT